MVGRTQRNASPSPSLPATSVGSVIDDMLARRQEQVMRASVGGPRPRKAGKYERHFNQPPAKIVQGVAAGQNPLFLSLREHREERAYAARKKQAAAARLARRRQLLQVPKSERKRRETKKGSSTKREMKPGAKKGASSPTSARTATRPLQQKTVTRSAASATAASESRSVDAALEAVRQRAAAAASSCGTTSKAAKSSTRTVTGARARADSKGASKVAAASPRPARRRRAHTRQIKRRLVRQLLRRHASPALPSLSRPAADDPRVWWAARTVVQRRREALQPLRLRGELAARYFPSFGLRAEVQRLRWMPRRRALAVVARRPAVVMAEDATHVSVLLLCTEAQAAWLAGEGEETASAPPAPAVMVRVRKHFPNSSGTLLDLLPSCLAPQRRVKGTRALTIVGEFFPTRQGFAGGSFAKPLVNRYL